MAKTKEFENILNECLDRLIKGETIEACLARYPQYSAELEPLLKTALEARLAASIKPRPEFRQRAADEFQAAIRNLPAKKGWSGFKWQVRWVAPVAIVLVLLAGGTGMVAAATNALPDSPLYQVKLATESVQMAFTFSEQGKAELYTRFVDYRVEEIVKMAEEENAEQVEQTTERMNGQLVAMADLDLSVATQGEKSASYGLMIANDNAHAPSVSPAPPVSTTQPATTSTPTSTTIASPSPVTITQTAPAENNTAINNPPPEAIQRNTTEETGGAVSDIEKFRLTLVEKLEKNLQILRNQLEKAPEALKPAIKKAIEVLEQGYQQAIANLG
jgi:hypothetical protein